MCGKCSPTKFANFLIIVLHVGEIVTTFGSKTFGSKMEINPHFATFRQQILEFLKGSFRRFHEFVFGRNSL